MNSQNFTHAIYAYLERIGNLVRSQEWALCRAHDLQPVQLRMLYYLGICNRYSNIPSGVTDYLQLTKGTVSQSLKALATKGLIEKQVDQKDKRQVHLLITDAGRAIFDQLPPDLLRSVRAELGEAATAETVSVLQRLLVTMQIRNEMVGFGVCRTCHYHQVLDERHFRCGLTEETLIEAEANLICREHFGAEEA